MRNYLIVLGAIALGLLGFQAYSQYKANQAPAKVGECISIQLPEEPGYPVSEAILFVQSDVKEKKILVVVIKVEVFGEKFYQPAIASYDDIRKSQPKKVNCSESFD